MTDSRAEKLRRRLQETFHPQELLVKDQSQLHVGHVGAKAGKGHFDVTIVSPAFAGTNRVERHRMIYHALSDLIESHVHALRIKALTPSERSQAETTADSPKPRKQ